MTGPRRCYAVLVVWNDGEQEYLKRGMGLGAAIFPSRRRAEERRDSMMEDLADEVQSINVVLAPGNTVRRLDG